METKMNIHVVISNYHHFRNEVLKNKNESYSEIEIIKQVTEKIKSKIDYYCLLENPHYESVMQEIFMNSNKIYWFYITNLHVKNQYNEIDVILNFKGTYESESIKDRICPNCISHINIEYIGNACIPYCRGTHKSMTRKNYYNKIMPCCECVKNKIIQDKTKY